VEGPMQISSRPSQVVSRLRMVITVAIAIAVRSQELIQVILRDSPILSDLHRRQRSFSTPAPNGCNRHFQELSNFVWCQHLIIHWPASSAPNALLPLVNLSLLYYLLIVKTEPRRCLESIIARTAACLCIPAKVTSTIGVSRASIPPGEPDRDTSKWDYPERRTAPYS